MLPEGLGAEIDTGSWQVPTVFEVMRSIGNVPVDDWRRTFNLGAGMILAVPESKAADAVKLLKKAKEPCWRIGQVVKLASKRRKRVEYSS